MSELLSEFERACNEAGVPPAEALKRGGVHPTLWPKWRDGKLGPTLKNFEAARRGLAEAAEARRLNRQSPQEAAA